MHARHVWTGLERLLLLFCAPLFLFLFFFFLPLFLVALLQYCTGAVFLLRISFSAPLLSTHTTILMATQGMFPVHANTCAQLETQAEQNLTQSYSVPRLTPRGRRHRLPHRRLLARHGPLAPRLQFRRPATSGSPFRFRFRLRLALGERRPTHEAAGRRGGGGGGGGGGVQDGPPGPHRPQDGEGQDRCPVRPRYPGRLQDGPQTHTPAPQPVGAPRPG